jgi:hypothetical protein
MRYQPVGEPITDFSDYMNSNLNEYEIKLLFIFYLYSTSSTFKNERNLSNHDNNLGDNDELNSNDQPLSKYQSLKMLLDVIIELAPELLTKAIVIKLIIECIDILKPLLLH